MVLLALKNFLSSAKKERTNFGTRSKVQKFFKAKNTIIRTFDLVPKIIKVSI
jgi:hypothetical protein